MTTDTGHIPAGMRWERDDASRVPFMTYTDEALYRRELERWRQMHASVEANLASVRQELAQARAYSEHLRSAYQSSEDGRKFHAARGEQLKADIEALKARIAELESRAT